jgi:hypothetical protein
MTLGPGPWLFFETCKESCSGGSSVVEHSSRHPSAKGSSAAVKNVLINTLSTVNKQLTAIGNNNISTYKQ